MLYLPYNSEAVFFITQFDASVLMYYANKFWIGATYRYQDAIVGLIGVEISKTFRVVILMIIAPLLLNHIARVHMK